MGKLKKEIVNEIRRLGEEGYTTAEIADSLNVHRDTVRKYRVGAGSSVVLKNTGESRLSDGVRKRLYDLQGILGAESVLDALETAYRDEVSAQKFKLTLWGEYAPYGEEFTVEGLVQKLKEFAEELESELKIYEDGYAEDQQTIKGLEVSSRTKYDEGYEAGYGKAKQDHAIFVGCSYCDRPIPIEPMGAAHATITNLLSEVGWGHALCINQAQYESEKGIRRLPEQTKV